MTGGLSAGGRSSRVSGRVVGYTCLAAKHGGVLVVMVVGEGVEGTTEGCERLLTPTEVMTGRGGAGTGRSRGGSSGD